MRDSEARLLRLQRGLDKGVEARMKIIHEHLRRKDSDEPIPDLQSEDLPKKRRLDNAFVKLTVKTGAPQGVRIEDMLQSVDADKVVQSTRCGDDNNKRGCEILAVTVEAQRKVPDLAKKTVARETPATGGGKMARTG